MAELYFAKNPDWKVPMPGSDYEQLRTLLGTTAAESGEIEAEIDRIAEVVRGAMEAHVQMVVRLASALMTRITLNHTDAVRAITEVNLP